MQNKIKLRYYNRRRNRDLELLRHKWDTLQRNLQWTYRQQAIVAGTHFQIGKNGYQQYIPDNRVIFKYLGDLLDKLDENENFSIWKLLLKLIQELHKLSDYKMKFLNCSKLKREALKWLHSKPEHPELTAGQLLYKLGSIFEYYKSKLELQKKFESRIWKSTETFTDYYIDKVILANNIPIAETELLNYIVDGIPDDKLKKLARLQDFSSAYQLLSTFRYISLSIQYKINNYIRGNGHLSMCSLQPQNMERNCFYCGNIDPQLKNSPEWRNSRKKQHQTSITPCNLIQSSSKTGVHSDQQSTTISTITKKNDSLEELIVTIQFFVLFLILFLNIGKRSFNSKSKYSYKEGMDEKQPLFFRQPTQLQREKICPKPIELLQPYDDMSASIKQLKRVDKRSNLISRFNSIANKVICNQIVFNHYKIKGIYSAGKIGKEGTRYNKYSMVVAKDIINSLKDFKYWKSTSTTPYSVLQKFEEKLDVPPVENHKYERELQKIYYGMADYFKSQGFKLEELTWDELEESANQNSGPGCTDTLKNMEDFMNQPNWKDEVDKVRQSLRMGKPIHAIFTATGVREKKMSSSNSAKPRIISYLPMATRLLEQKLFKNLLNLTKPKINRFGVGGLGLHDYGMRMNEIWQGWGMSDDISCYDTSISLYLLSLESEFIQLLGGNEDMVNMYRVYAYPHILLTVPSIIQAQSLLLAGRGQRMSGTNPTYAMNTITRIAIILLQLAVAKNIRIDQIAKWTVKVMRGEGDIVGLVSGDDAVVSAKKETILQMSNAFYVLDEIGMKRKGIESCKPTPISNRINDMSFCSHRFEKISFYDSVNDMSAERYMPTRNVAEIVAKSCIQLKFDNYGDSKLAWTSGQGNNLLVNYPHFKLCRLLGFANKALTPANITFEPYNQGFRKPRPWLIAGEPIDILNKVHFGKSTNYPVPNFKVRQWFDINYLDDATEKLYDPECLSNDRIEWERNLRHIVAKGIKKYHIEGNENMCKYLPSNKRVFKNNMQLHHNTFTSINAIQNAFANRICV